MIGSAIFAVAVACAPVVTGGEPTADPATTVGQRGGPTATPAVRPTAEIATGRWGAGSPMAAARADHHAVLLGDGRVLVFGGLGDGGALVSSEVYDPVTDTWSSAGDTNVPRRRSAMALLDDGRVLAAGGLLTQSTATAEVFDPATGKWTTVEPMATPREDAVAIRLDDGRVLVVGGGNSQTGGDEDDIAVSLAEIFEPNTGRWVPAGRTVLGRLGLKGVAKLPDGRVLIAGGVFGRPNVHTELFDPVTLEWTVLADLPVPNGGGSAEMLADGSVMLTGGGLQCCTRDTLIYSPVIDEWFEGPQMKRARADHFIVRLQDGRLLAMLGINPNRPFDPTLRWTEIYSPERMEWTIAQDYPGPVTRVSAPVVLENGRVMLAGGMPSDGVTRFSADVHIYVPPEG